MLIHFYQDINNHLANSSYIKTAPAIDQYFSRRKVRKRDEGVPFSFEHAASHSKNMPARRRQYVMVYARESSRYAIDKYNENGCIKMAW